MMMTVFLKSTVLPLCIGQSAVVKDLKHDIENVGVSLFRSRRRGLPNTAFCGLFFVDRPPSSALAGAGRDPFVTLYFSYSPTYSPLSFRSFRCTLPPQPLLGKLFLKFTFGPTGRTDGSVPTDGLVFGVRLCLCVLLSQRRLRLHPDRQLSYEECSSMLRSLFRFLRERGFFFNWGIPVVYVTTSSMSSAVSVNFLCRFRVQFFFISSSSEARTFSLVTECCSFFRNLISDGVFLFFACNSLDFFFFTLHIRRSGRFFMRSLDAASSIRSIALSGKKRSLTLTARKSYRTFQWLHENFDAVMSLIFVPDTFQNGYGIFFGGGFGNDYRLETTFKRRVFFRYASCIRQAWSRL